MFANWKVSKDYYRMLKKNNMIAELLVITPKTKVGELLDT
jgi:hypothetical protein